MRPLTPHCPARSLALLLAAGGLLWAPLTALAQANPAPSADTSSSVQDVPLWESARSSVRSTAEWLATGVDSWFGDRPFKDGGQVTDGRMSVNLLKRQDEGLDLNVRFNARFRLPNLENNAYLYFGRDNERELVADTPGAFSRQQRLLKETSANQAFFAGFGFALQESVDFRLGFRGGLKPYAQVRYRHPWELSPVDLLEFRQTLFWSLADHLGATTALSYSHVVSPTLVARWLTVATITQESKKLEWSSIVGGYQSFGAQRLLSLEALASGETKSGLGLSDYGLQTKWEQPVYKDWLQGEILIGHFWPRKDPLLPRGRAWALGAGLKMQF